jgi:hypothetical protein
LDFTGKSRVGKLVLASGRPKRPSKRCISTAWLRLRVCLHPTPAGCPFFTLICRIQDSPRPKIMA